MNRKIGFLIIPILVFGIISCTKTSSTESNTSIVTIDSTKIALSGYSKAKSFLNGDSIIIGNTDASSQSNISSVSTNEVIIGLSANKPITTGTYITGGNNFSNMIFAVQYQSSLFIGGGNSSVYVTSDTVRIATLSSSNITGSYSGTIVSSDFYTYKSIKGTFNANF